MDAFLSQEPIVRMGAFLSVFVLMALWELLAPRRECRVRKGYLAEQSRYCCRGCSPGSCCIPRSSRWRCRFC